MNGLHRCLPISALCLAVLAGCSVPEKSPDSGVPLSLAISRAERISNLTYDLSLNLPEQESASIEGAVHMTFDLADPSKPLFLDFAADSQQVHSVSANSVALAVSVQDEHIRIDASALKAGSNDVDISFVAGNRHLNRRTSLVYTLFVPEHARFFFPCFDQPDLKARYALELTIPSGWEALSNAPESSVVHREHRKTITFNRSQPLSTYHFAFLAGDFEIASANRNGREIRVFHREPDQEKLDRNIDSIFELHFDALDWMENYTGIPYPYDKFDIALIPAFQFGGMEHPGAIFYRDTSHLLGPGPSQSQLMGRASLIAHETAHMWFGDLVTMRWFDDVWTKEVFANFMAAKMLQPAFPDVDHQLNFYLRHYPSAYQIDRTAGTHPIHQDLVNLDDAASLYGALIYQKAPIVMRHLEMNLGEELLRDGLRTYLDTYRFGNASWNELIQILAQHTESPLEGWNHIWVNEAGRPTIAVDRMAHEGDSFDGIYLQTLDPLDESRMWPQPITVLFGYPGDIKASTVQLEGPDHKIAVEPGFPAPSFVLPGADGIAYGLVRPDERSLRLLPAHLTDLHSDVHIAVAWQTLMDNMLESRVDPEEMIHSGISLIRSDVSELLKNRLLDDLSEIFWRFIPEEIRLATADSLEQEIWQILSMSSTSTLRKSAFDAYRRIAMTEEGIAVLSDLWHRELEIAGLELGDSDFENLAFDLAIRDVPRAADILDAQIARLDDPERRERFRFIRPSLINDLATRDSVFSALLDVENRSREPWALASLGWLNHPLRADASITYLEPGLEVLEEIKSTGTIFFPKRWLDALFSGHNSNAAVAAIDQYLDARPDLSPRLRQKVEQSTDVVRRSAKQGSL